MTMHAGLANEHHLAPFFPAGRNTDGLFSILLRRLYPDSTTVWHPAGYLHNHPEKRFFDETALTDFAPRLAELADALAVAAALDQDTDSAERLQQLCP